MCDRPQQYPNPFVNAGNAVYSTPYDTWSRYIEGYLQAATFLADSLQSTQNDFDSPLRNDSLYALIFLYRHYLELTMKHLLDVIRQRHNRDLKIPMTHDLNQLFTLSLEQAGPYLPLPSNPHHDRRIFDKEMRQAKQLIMNFHRVDIGSYSFRYPIDKKRNPSLPNALAVDLEQLKQQVAAFSEAFRKAQWAVEYFGT